MSAKYAVLGLVIERPGYGYQLAQRLEQRFGSSAFAPSGVYSSLDQLSRDGHVRAAGALGKGPPRRAAPRMIYEATEAGVEHFEAWMLGSSPAPPLRDELHMKMALCRPRNLPRLIDMVRGQELACLGRMRDLRRLSELDAAGESREWSRLMRILAREAEIELWSARVGWLQSSRRLLEGLVEDCRRLPREPARQPGARHPSAQRVIGGSLAPPPRGPRAGSLTLTSQS